MSDEMPPEWMWPLGHEIERWFAQVKADRDEKYGNKDESNKSAGMQNDYAKGMR